jgi:hypothetical protein
LYRILFATAENYGAGDAKLVISGAATTHGDGTNPPAHPGDGGVGYLLFVLYIISVVISKMLSSVKSKAWK